MADNRETILVDIQLDAGKVAKDLQDVSAKAKALRNQANALRQEIRNGNDENGAMSRRLAEVNEELSWTNKQMKGLSATTKLMTADVNTYSDSLNGERQKLADLQKMYDQLDKTMRNSDGGKALLEQIKEQDAVVKGLEEDTGRFQRNVGNYPSALTKAIPGFDKLSAALGSVGVKFEDLGTSASGAIKGIGAGLKNLGKQAMSLLANPVILAIAAVLVVLKQLYDAFQRNERAQLAWEKAIAPVKAAWQGFQRVFDDIIKAFQRMGDAFGANGKTLETLMRVVLLPINALMAKIRVQILLVSTAIEAMGRAFTAGVEKLKEFAANTKIAEQFNKLRDAVSGFKDKVVSMKDAIVNSDFGKRMGLDKIAGGIRDIIGANSELIEQNKKIAQGEADIAKMTRNNLKEDADAQREIAELRAKVAEKDKYTSAQRLQFLQEANNKEEAIARRAYELAQKKYEVEVAKNSLTESNAEDLERENQAYADMVATQTAYLNKQKELNAKMAALREQEEAARLATLKKEQDIARMAEDFALSLIKDEGAKAIAERKIQGDREIAQLKERLNTEEGLTAQARDTLAKLIKDKQTALDAELEQMAIDAAKAKTDAEMQAEADKAMRILEYKRELAEEGSEEELAIQKMILDAKLEQALNATELEEEEKDLIRQTYAKKREELDKQYLENLKKTATSTRETYKAALMDTAKNASSAFGAMQSLLSEYGKENQKAAAASKAFGIAKIVTDQAMAIADTAKAISSAVAGATEAAAATGPAAPFTLAAYIAAMVGAVLGAVGSVAASIAQAKQLIGSAPAGKFAEGGFIPGNSYTGDRMVARVNSGEAVLTPQQQQNFMNLANTPSMGFDMNAFADVLVAAVAAQPAPVMDYSEFTTFQQRVSTYNEIAAI